MVPRRVPFREEHLRLAREARERGELVLAGALADPVDRALLVFHVDDKSKAESFARKDPYVVRSEEHTSELQSQSNLVCRLLLEKKKTNLHEISSVKSLVSKNVIQPVSVATSSVD